eukprot:jgi/Undpi1/4313/HiC_scaffold_17.g07679.m1
MGGARFGARSRSAKGADLVPASSGVAGGGGGGGGDGRSSATLLGSSKGWLAGVPARAGAAARSTLPAPSPTHLDEASAETPTSLSPRKRQQLGGVRTEGGGGGVGLDAGVGPGGGGGGGGGLAAAAAANGVFLSGIALTPRYSSERAPQVFPPTGGGGDAVGVGSLVGSLTAGSGGASTASPPPPPPPLLAQPATTAAVSDPDVLDKALTATGVAGPRPGSGRWPGLAVADGGEGGAAAAKGGGAAGGGKAGAGGGGAKIALLASSGSWSEAPDDQALTKKFRVSLMFYTKELMANAKQYGEGDKLALYGLFKQAKWGDCPAGLVSAQRDNPVGSVKVRAWVTNRSKPTSQAMQEFIAVLGRQQQLNQLNRHNQQQQQQRAKRTGGGGGGSPVSPTGLPGLTREVVVVAEPKGVATGVEAKGVGGGVGAAVAAAVAAVTDGKHL